eukprot:11947509-Ditylum_brightwellii.AAC.1
MAQILPRLPPRPNLLSTYPGSPPVSDPGSTLGWFTPTGGLTLCPTPALRLWLLNQLHFPSRSQPRPSSLRFQAPLSLAIIRPPALALLHLHQATCYSVYIRK